MFKWPSFDLTVILRRLTGLLRRALAELFIFQMFWKWRQSSYQYVFRKITGCSKCSCAIMENSTAVFELGPPLRVERSYDNHRNCTDHLTDIHRNCATWVWLSHHLKAKLVAIIARSCGWSHACRNRCCWVRPVAKMDIFHFRELSATRSSDRLSHRDVSC